MIICGIDDSAGARRAAIVARDLARRLDAPLTIVTVFSPILFVPPEGRTPGTGQDRQALLTERRTRAEATLAAVAKDAGIDPTVETKVMAGDPARILIEEAKKGDDATLIVVGSRGQGAIRAAILGSVSSHLVREAPCPVVVVPAESE
jgi:nucleotide-binding universal stress UspA family protein